MRSAKTPHPLHSLSQQDPWSVLSAEPEAGEGRSGCTDDRRVPPPRKWGVRFLTLSPAHVRRPAATAARPAARGAASMSVSEKPEQKASMEMDMWSCRAEM